MATRFAILRSTTDELGSRYLEGRLSEDGELRLKGQDLGRGVGKVYSGYSEYEWVLTVKPEGVAQLAAALDAGDDVLKALSNRYSEGKGFVLESFLDEQGIKYEVWSRIGD